MCCLFAFTFETFCLILCPARDSWKKRYFETKKATAPLEGTLRNIRQELETFYNKLLHQLQARDWRGRARRQGRSSTKVSYTNTAFLTF